jgi:hypothetical protein
MYCITANDVPHAPQEQPKAQVRAFALSLCLGLFNQEIIFYLISPFSLKNLAAPG